MCDGAFPSIIQEHLNNFGEIPECGSPCSNEENILLDIPGGPVNLFDCRRTRISKSHSDAEKRERKLVLARLRQRRFRERMKKLRGMSEVNFQELSNSADVE